MSIRWQITGSKVLRGYTRFLTTSAKCATPRHLDPTGRAPGFARRLPRGQPVSQSDNNHGTTPGSSSGGGVDKVSNALQQSAEGDTSQLISPVHIPEDPDGILKENHPATSLLANPSIVVQRQLEMMNVFLGFEQANKYIIMDPQGNHIGYLAEQEHGIGNAIARQLARTHRSFTTHVFDKSETEVLRFHRPFAWINSRIRVYDTQTSSSTAYTTSSSLQGTSLNQTAAQISQTPLADMRVIGEAQQQWAPLRRKYNLFLARDLSRLEPNPNAPQLTSGDLPLSTSTALTVADEGRANIGFTQFASVNEPFLSWDFSLKSEDDRLIGSVNRNFSGFAREIFTDTGVYALRMDAAGLANDPQQTIPQTAQDRSRAEASQAVGMTLDQRAIMLATAVSIDFDYFSRHSTAGIGGGGFMPMWFPVPMGGPGGAAGEAGAAEGGAGGAVTNAGDGARGVGSAEGAVAGAGTMAGYEAMQRGREQQADQDGFLPDQQEAAPRVDDPWAQHTNNDPWSQQNDNDPWGGGGGGDGGGGGGGGGDGGGWGDLF